MSEKKYVPQDQEKKLCEWVNSKFKQAYVAKAPLMQQWKKYMDAYEGTYFKTQNKPDYKSDEISNMVFSIVETIRPIMTDNNPKFIAVPTNPDGLDFTGSVQMALDYEWDREKLGMKLPASLISMLVYGTSVWFVSWDGKQGEYGEISVKPVDPFNIFPDPLAEDVDNSEFIVYATYKNANQLKQQFPKKASAIEGSRISLSELVSERDANDSRSENQVLVLEMWCRDWTSMDETINESGEKEKQLKYPKGRVITVLPDLGIVLDDKKNPYKDGKFPFVLMKDYDIPFKFWGVGEVEQILSPQHYVNELTNQIIDNAKATANMPWIIDKNSGIGHGKLTNRPGLVIRKNPGTEVRRDAPPPMPTYTRDQIQVLKQDMQDISGVFDSLKGEKQSGVVAASAIMALQEASQSRIRLKIKIMEAQLSELAGLVYSRMQQFWKLDRWVRITDIEGNPNFQQITQEILKNDFDLKVIAGSTMPTNKNAMLDLMIRLAQTNGEDGLPLVDRTAVLEFLPGVDKKAIINRFEEQKAQQQQEAQMQQQQALEQQQLANQQQQGQLDQDTTQQVFTMLQELVTVNDATSKQVDELIMDKESRDKTEYEGKIEEKGYKRGVKDGKAQTEEKEKEIGEEDDGSNNNNIVSNLSANIGDEMPREEELAMQQLQTQQIPIGALEELIQLSQEDPEQFQAILEQFPQITEMLQKDMNGMNGGQM